MPDQPQSSSNPEAGPSTLPELPWAFIDCPTDTLVILISHMLNLLIEHNDQVVLTPDALTRFHSRAPPGISVIEYLRRIVKYTNMEKIPLLSLLAYIDITCLALPTFTLSSLTVHRFLIAGVCAGSKAQCDVFCTNAHYAKVGGIKTGELNALEREFLRVTGWALCCTPDLLQRYYTSLIRSHGGYTQAAAPEISPFFQFSRSNSKPTSPASETSSLHPESDGEWPTAVETETEPTSQPGEDDEMIEENRESTSKDGRARKTRRKASGDIVVDEMIHSRRRDRSRSSSRGPRNDSKDRPPDYGLVNSDCQQTSNSNHESAPIITSSNNSANDDEYSTPPETCQQTESTSNQPESGIPMEVDQPNPPAAAPPPHSPGESSSIPSSSRSSFRSVPFSPPGSGAGSTTSSRRSHNRSRAVSMTSTPRLAEPQIDKSMAFGEGVPWDEESTTTTTSESGMVIPTSSSSSSSDYPQTSQPNLLKHLVGGIFRRRSHTGNIHPGSHNGGGTHHFRTGPTVQPIHDSHSNHPNFHPPILGKSVLPTPSQPLRSPRPSGSSGPTGSVQGPGAGRNIVPRVRNRDERSVDSLRSSGVNRNASSRALEGLIG